MADTARIDLFVEDVAQESLARALTERLAEEQGVRPILTARSARGGLGRALDELAVFQKGLSQGALIVPTPDILVVFADANSRGWVATRNAVLEVIDGAVFPRVAVACPDPYVEAWYLADLAAAARVIGAGIPPLRMNVSAADRHKLRLTEAVQAGTVISLDGGLDLAPNIVQEMDAYRAEQAHPSLKDFLTTMRGHLADVGRL